MCHGVRPVIITVLHCGPAGNYGFVSFQLKGFAQSELLAHLYSSRDQASSAFELITVKMC